MDSNEMISIEDMITQLNDLANDRKSFFSKDGDDEIFRQDYRALIRAIQLLEKLSNLQ